MQLIRKVANFGRANTRDIGHQGMVVDNQCDQARAGHCNASPRTRTPAVAIAHTYTDTFEVAVSLRQEDIDES
jgi:hypothetical protein